MRFHLDEHLPHAIAEGLRRRGIDVTTTVEAGLRGASDDVHLAYALEQRRVIVTIDIRISVFNGLAPMSSSG